MYVVFGNTSLAFFLLYFGLLNRQCQANYVLLGFQIMGQLHVLQINSIRAFDTQQDMLSLC